MKLVWLFQDYRTLYADNLTLANRLEMLSDKYLRAEEDNKKLVEALAQMQEYVTQTASQSPVDLFERYQKQILQDEPYVDGKIPDTAWLTPGELEAVKNG